MDDTDMPCKDLHASKQKRPEKGHSSIQEIGKDGCDQLKDSVQVSDGEEDFNAVELPIGSAYSYFNEVVGYNNLKAIQLPQRGYKPALINQASLVSQSQLNTEVNRSSHELCVDSDQHRQNREELLKTPCEQIQSEEFIEKNDQNSTVHPPKNVIKDVKEDRGCASRFTERDFTADCFTEIKVKDGGCLQIGQHLTMPGWYLRKVYRHNAILYDVVSCQGQFVELELLHFTKRNGRTDIFKTTEKYDLGTADLRIIVCQYQKHSPNEIIQMAESMLNGVARGKFKKYNLFTNNCEHFAMWCAVGIKKSFQVKKIQDIMKIFVAYIVLHYFSSGLNFVS